MVENQVVMDLNAPGIVVVKNAVIGVQFFIIKNATPPTKVPIAINGNNGTAAAINAGIVSVIITVAVFINAGINAPVSAPASIKAPICTLGGIMVSNAFNGDIVVVKLVNVVANPLFTMVT